MIKKQLKKAPFSISGFTLVELIVVISILVILGTISFISFSGYLSTSRDSKRISNTAVITKGFDITLIVGSPINTSKTATGYNIAIAGTGLTMTGYYGVVTDSLLQSIKVFGKDIATYDGFQEYRYSYFPNEKKFQVLSTLENIDNAKSTFIIPSLIDQAFAATAMGYAYIKGNFTATGGIDTIVVDGATWNGTVPTAATVNGITTFTGGQTAIAAAPIAVVAGVSQPAPGICWTTAPTSTTPTFLCSQGTPSSVVDAGVNNNYTWTCAGINGDNSVTSCSATHSAINCQFTDWVIIGDNKFGDETTNFCTFAL